MLRIYMRIRIIDFWNHIEILPLQNTRHKNLSIRKPVLWPILYNFHRLIFLLYISELRRRKHVVWHPPNISRRSLSRNSEPSYNFNSTIAGRPQHPRIALRSLSLRMGPNEKAFGILEPPNLSSPIIGGRRYGSSTVLTLENPHQSKSTTF